jgi:hypothetical protein
MKIVEEDGLIAILDAIDWFQLHSEVVNWGLWAVFMSCYNHVGNKIQFVRMDGIARVCRAAILASVILVLIIFLMSPGLCLNCRPT